MLPLTVFAEGLSVVPGDDDQRSLTALMLFQPVQEALDLGVDKGNLPMTLNVKIDNLAPPYGALQL